jgi:hypothetical protein
MLDDVSIRPKHVVVRYAKDRNKNYIEMVM